MIRCPYCRFSGRWKEEQNCEEVFASVYDHMETERRKTKYGRP